MSEPVPDNPVFALDDLAEHVENYGVDIFPPLDIPKETVRAQAFFLELRDRWPYLFENVTVGGADFRMQTTFQAANKQQLPFTTFNVNARGPVFIFPRRLTALGGDIDLRSADPPKVFEEAFQLFLRSFPGRTALRVGLVRTLVFNTGHTDCTTWLGRAVVQFDAAHLSGAQCVLAYVEDNFNIRIQLDPVQVTTVTLVPGAGATGASHNQYGLSTSLDVNNRELRPLTSDEIQAVLRKANELWPGRLLQFLNSRSLS
jgi:hypothetical protein